MSFSRHLLLLALVVLVGCSPGPQVTGTAQEVTPEETVKTQLVQLSETGQIGSEIGLMMQALEEMKATDSAKAEALLTDANAMMSASGPDAVKALAEKMLEKLSGAPEGSASPSGDAPAEE